MRIGSSFSIRPNRASGRRPPDEQAEDNADPGQDKDLQEIRRHDDAARSSHALQGRDRRRLAVEVGVDGIGDAEAADQERRHPGEPEEHAEPVDEAVDAGGGLGGIADLPAGARKRGPRARHPCGRRASPGGNSTRVA